MKDSEYQMIEELKAGQCSVERGLLMVSVLGEEGIANYQRKLDQIQRDFEQATENGPQNRYETAQSLFHFLWRDNTLSSQLKSGFLLTEIIDNKLAGFNSFGNCVGLTSLYSVLGIRQGLDLTILYNTSHILNRLYYGEKEVWIENTNEEGFDCSLMKRHTFWESDFKVLVSAALNSRALLKKESGELAEARSDFTKAIEVEPRFPVAYTNRAIINADLGDLSKAMQDCDKALELKPDYAEAFNNRGIIKFHPLQDIEGAIADYNRAIVINPNYAAPFFNRGVAKEYWGDLVGAMEDYRLVLALDPKHKKAADQIKNMAKPVTV